MSEETNLVIVDPVTGLVTEQSVTKRRYTPEQSTEPRKVMSLTPEQIELIKNTIAKGATNDQFEMFMHICKSYGLDPLKKEIYFINQGGRVVTMVSRDGFLAIANGFDVFNGMEADVIYEGDKISRRDDGSVKIEYGENHIKFEKKMIKGAFANVYRKDRDVVSSAVVSFIDYYKSTNSTWQTYPNAMILKCAESIAIKKAFSLSGLVSSEELEK